MMLGMTVRRSASQSWVQLSRPIPRRNELRMPKFGSKIIAQSSPLIASEMITGMK